MSANAHLLPSSPLVDSTMQRPASRGGPVKPKMLAGMEGDSKAPMMGGGGMPAAMGMTRGGMTGTARGGARPNSALKRVPTAQKVEGPPPGMVGLSTDVKVEARPLTSGGLSGMASRGAGPGRQLADVSYWRMELRNKIADITRETDAMVAEVTKKTADNANYGLLERKYDVIVREVRQLEGSLADFNLALDKHRTNTDLNEIKNTYNVLKAKNDVDRKTIDQVFMQSAQYEKSAKDTEEQISRIQAKAEERLSSLGQELRMEYSDLQDESADLAQRIAAKEQRLAEIEQKIASTQSHLKSSKYQIHARGIELEKKKAELTKKRAELEEETNTNITPQQIKEKLLSKVKDANAETAAAEKKIKQLEEALETVQESVKKKEEELSDLKKYLKKAKQYEEVYARDQKMQEFINKYPEVKQSEFDNKRKLQETIAALMKHISKSISLQRDMPDADRFDDVKKELTFKEEKLKSAKNTRMLLEKELENRKAELQRIAGLEKKIPQELQSLKEKVSAMQSEMNAFKSADELQREADEAKKNLLIVKQKLLKQREAIKQQVSQLSAANKKRELELQSSEVFKKIVQLEKTLTAHSQNNFQIGEFIGQRKRESDYEGLQKECAALTNDINTLLIAQMNQKL